MSNQNNIDLIEKYLSFEMDDTERSDFESQLRQNEELQAEFQRRETAHQALDFLIAENLRAELRTMEQQSTKVVSLASRRRRSFTLAIAASVLVLIGAFFMFLPSKTSSPLQLAMDNYDTPAFTIRGSNEPTALSDGIAALEAQQYEDAIVQLEKVEVGSGHEIAAHYFLGHAYFLTEQYDQAENKFELAAAGQDLRYTEDAQWYGLLSCLATNKNCDAKLQDILTTSNHSYMEEAQELSQRLTQ